MRIASAAEYNIILYLGTTNEFKHDFEYICIHFALNL